MTPNKTDPANDTTTISTTDIDTASIDTTIIKASGNTTNKKSEIQKIREELQTLNRHRFVRTQNSMMRMLLQFFLKGLAFGFGSVLGASIVVSIVISLLGQIEFIPIIGEYAKEIMIEIQQHKDAL